LIKTQKIMIKLTVLYGHPTDPAAFESYYASTHMPLVGTIPGLAKTETTIFLPEADGSNASYYRLAELYFESSAALQSAMSTPQGQAAVADLANFASGGVKVMVGMVE
jgi:uncharacterized protein (TIGR02118 family)